MALPAPPPGFRPSVVAAGDDLARLERESGVHVSLIMEANGVKWPGSKTCKWGNAVGDVVEATSPDRARALVNGTRDRALCGRDVVLLAGQVLNLPTGVRPAAPGASPATPGRTKKSNAGKVAAVVGLGLLGLAGLVAGAQRKKAA